MIYYGINQANTGLMGLPGSSLKILFKSTKKSRNSSFCDFPAQPCKSPGFKCTDQEEQGPPPGLAAPCAHNSQLSTIPALGFSFPAVQRWKESPNSKQDSVKGGFFSFFFTHKYEWIPQLGALQDFGKRDPVWEKHGGVRALGAEFWKAVLEIWDAPGGNGAARAVPHPSLGSVPNLPFPIPAGAEWPQTGNLNCLDNSNHPTPANSTNSSHQRWKTQKKKFQTVFSPTEMVPTLVYLRFKLSRAAEWFSIHFKAD